MLPEGDGSRTFYEGIKQLPPACCLTVQGNTLRSKRYWHIDRIPDIRFAHDEEYISAFKEVYGEAVRCRMRSDRPVAVTLSGGLDSGSVAYFASKVQKDRGERLAAFTSIPKYPTDNAVLTSQIGNEGRLAKQVAEHLGNVDVHWVRAENKTPLAGIEDLFEALGHPIFGASNSFWISRIFERARDEGFGTILLGQYGNASVSWVGNRTQLLGGLMRTRQWNTYRQEFQAFKHHGQLSWATALRALFLSPLVPLTWREKINDMGAGKTPWSQYSAMNPKLAHRFQIRQRMRELKVFQQTPHHPEYRLKIMLHGLHAANAVSATIASSFGLDLRDPTADRRLIEFCMGIPENQYICDGQNRLLIRRAMKDLLPAEVLWSRRKGLQSADIIQRMRADATNVSQMLNRIAHSETAMEHLDIHQMKQVFAEAMANEDPKTSARTRGILLRGMMIGLFLSQFDS